MLQNHFLIRKLITTLSTHPVVVPLAPHTAQSIFHPWHLRPWTRKETVEGMKAICTRWGFWEDGGSKGRAKGGVSMLSHSNGSIAHSWGESGGWALRSLIADSSAKRLPVFGQAEHICRPRVLCAVGRRHLPLVLLPNAEDCQFDGCYVVKKLTSGIASFIVLLHSGRSGHRELHSTGTFRHQSFITSRSSCFLLQQLGTDRRND